MTTWSNRTKPTTDFDSRFSYLLMEDGGFLLNEDGTKILISKESSKYTLYNNSSKPNTIWS